MSPARRVVVIGGGVAGLATAALLAADGHEVTLLEAAETFGGRAGSWSHDGFRFDTGPSWYLMPEVFDHFFRVLGTSTEAQLSLTTLDPGYRTYFEGDSAPFDLPAGSERARAALRSLDPGAGPAIDRYLDSAGRTYHVALERFLYGSFDAVSPYLDRELIGELPLLGRLLTRSLDAHIQAHTSEPRLRRLLGYPAVFLGGSPMSTPAMYHLMSHLDVDDGVRYPAGGFAAVIESLVAVAHGAGARLRAGADVRKIVVERGAARGVVLDGSGEVLEADVVVAAADLHHVETELLDPEHRDHSPRWWSRREAGPGAVLAMLGVRGEVPELAHHTLLLARDWDEAFRRIGGGELPDAPSLYIGKPSQTDPTVAPPGHENLFVLVPVPARPELGNGGIDRGGDPHVEAYVDRVIEQIARWTGALDLADRVVVRRTVAPGDFARDLRAWRGSALGPAHTLRQSALLRAGNASGKVSGLYFAGSSTIPGIGVPMCLISAELVLKRLRGDTSARPVVA